MGRVKFVPASYCRGIYGIFFVLWICAPAVSLAGWMVDGDSTFPSNRDTTLTLKLHHESVGDSTAGDLWISGGSNNILFPDTVSILEDRAELPVFARRTGDYSLTLFDSRTKTTSSIQLTAIPPTEKEWCLPRMIVHGEDEKPVLYSSRPTTVTLELESNMGDQPKSAHVMAKDHRGRVVFSRFFSMFEMLGGLAALQIPAPGQFEVHLTLLDDPVTSYPRAMERDPVAIPLGETHNDLPELGQLPDGVTTKVVLATRVSLEHLSTTATVLGYDRTQVTVLGVPSKEIQRNRWPYAIIGPEMVDIENAMPRGEAIRQIMWHRRLGSSFVRVNINWSDVQRSPGSFYWGRLNTVLPLYRQGLVRPLLTMKGRSAWSDELPTETTATLTAWGNLMGQIAEKYEKYTWGVHVWEEAAEAWENPDDYFQLLDATLDAYQYRNGERVPAPPIVAGNLKGFDADYFDDLVTTATDGRLSGISFELYPEDPTVSPEDNGFGEVLDKAAKFLEDRGTTTVKFWVTGTGWPAGPDGVSRKLQANFMVRTHVMALGRGAYKIYWNNLVDRSADWDVPASHRMGLLNTDFYPNSSGAAYNAMAYMVSGVSPVDITRQGDATIYAFNIPLQSNKWPGTLYVAWTESPDQEETIRLDMKHGGGVYAFDYLGAEVSTHRDADGSDNAITGSYTLKVGYEPVYIWDAGKAAR